MTKFDFSRAHLYRVVKALEVDGLVVSFSLKNAPDSKGLSKEGLKLMLDTVKESKFSPSALSLLDALSLELTVDVSEPAAMRDRSFGSIND